MAGLITIEHNNYTIITLFDLYLNREHHNGTEVSFGLKLVVLLPGNEMD